MSQWPVSRSSEGGEQPYISISPVGNIKMTILWQQCKLQYVYRQTPSFSIVYIFHIDSLSSKNTHICLAPSHSLFYAMDVDAYPRLLLLFPYLQKEPIEWV